MSTTPQPTEPDSQTPTKWQDEDESHSTPKPPELDQNPGFAAEGEPQWAPPESQPEPLPIEPVMNLNSTFPSQPFPHTQSPT